MDLHVFAERECQPALSQIEFDYAATAAQGLFALALRKDVKNPFPPESDEVTLAKERRKPAGNDKAKAEEKKEEKRTKRKKRKPKEYIRIDFRWTL